MILITGANGNVGKEVLKQVATTETKTGMKIRAGFRSPAKVAAPPGVEIVTLDYNQPETLRAALEGVDRVFLVGPPTAQLVALERRAVDAIKQSNVRQVVKLSAMGGRESTFPRLHAESEEYVVSSGVPYTFLRPNGFMQNFVSYNASTINSQNAFYGSEGEGRVSYIDIRDIAAVAVKALTEAGHGTRTKSRESPFRRWRSAPRPPHAGRFCLPAPSLRAVFAAHRPSVYTLYAPASLGTLRASAFRKGPGDSPPVPPRSAATSPRPRPARLPS
jgi:uncharacterized protein YbjT (DUF2867 family)